MHHTAASICTVPAVDGDQRDVAARCIWEKNWLCSLNAWGFPTHCCYYTGLTMLKAGARQVAVMRSAASVYVQHLHLLNHAVYMLACAIDPCRGCIAYKALGHKHAGLICNERSRPGIESSSAKLQDHNSVKSCKK